MTSYSPSLITIFSDFRIYVFAWRLLLCCEPYFVMKSLSPFAGCMYMLRKGKPKSRIKPNISLEAQFGRSSLVVRLFQGATALQHITTTPNEIPATRLYHSHHTLSESILVPLNAAMLVLSPPSRIKYAHKMYPPNLRTRS